jgi:rhodanese-related sulfurtransferase
MNTSTAEHFSAKLAFEIDSSDLFEVLEARPNIIVIDARRSFAFEKEHIPGAVNLAYGDMSPETTKTFDRNTLYVVYCDGIGCNALTKGCLNMAKLGFSVKEMIGGLEYWKVDGFPTEGTLKNPVNDVRCAC